MTTFWRIVLTVTAAAALTGAVAGLAVGLVAYPPTAPFAAVELGLPAAIVGFLLALPVAGLATRGRPS